MYMLDRTCRTIVVGLLAVLCGAVVAFPANAQSNATKPGATALPEPLTPETVRELVARQSDEQVRQLLIEQLDRGAAAPVNARGDKGMSKMVEQDARMVRERLGELRDAFVALPATSRQVVANLDDPQGPTVLPRVGALLVGGLVIAWLVEHIYNLALRRYRKRLAPPPDETFAARSFRLAIGLVLSLVGIAVFALAFLALFLALWQGHALRRIAIVEVLIAVVAARVTWLFADFLLSRRAGQERLLPLPDVPAGRLRWFAVMLAALWGLGNILRAVFTGGGANAATIDLLIISTGLLGLSLVLWTVWHVRAAIADLIRGDGTRGAVARWPPDH